MKCKYPKIGEAKRKNGDYERASERMRLNNPMKNPEIKRKHKEIMNSPEMKKILIENNPMKKLSARKKLSRTLKRLHAEGKIKINHVKPSWKFNGVGRKLSSITRGKISKANIGRKHTEEEILKIKKARYNQIFPKKDTSIESKIQGFLRLLNIEFLAHYYTSEISHAYRCDILIPVQNEIIQKTIIECDGNYWHGNPILFPNPNKFQKEQMEEDKIRTQELIESGFRVIRLWEDKIKVMKLEDFQLIIR